VAELLHGLDVPSRAIAERLAADLTERAEQSDDARRELVHCGLPAVAHGEMLRAAELRHLHRADPELVRLQDEAASILGQVA